MSDPLRVLSFESRKGDEMRSLIERNGGAATIAPAMKEVTLGMTDEIRTFFERLKEGTLDLLVFLTGVGTEALATAIETEHSREELLELMQRCRIVVRGPKPFAVLRKWNVRIDARAAEPNTWHEVVQSVLEVAGSEHVGTERPLEGCRIAVQEYGEPASGLYSELEKRGAAILPVPIYKWALPDDTAPLESAIEATIRGDFDVVLFTTAQHMVHVLKIADRMGKKDEWLAAARKCVVASIGPTASERMIECGLPVDFQPTHPHMGHLVRESLEAAAGLLESCRAR
ncbi:MAG: uroporphyrinogen-III synthase [Planctomycetota bacterium]|nr:uroporphyrinogen-III synthase [Planctomycetota bacterium]MDA0919822.1 uroporphyrinogen-III synthase [Planctomycetota bacterium]MDA1160662.1 uroporphyrinogen-III synthase [Planctomycetota bacterium]